MSSDREVLESAIELIESPENWTQGAFGRDVNGVGVGSEMGVSRCAYGAILHAARSIGHHNYIPVLEAVGKALPSPASQTITLFNDSHLHSEVILVMKRGLDHLPE